MHEEQIKKLKSWLERLGYAEMTVEGYIYGFKYFFNWLEKNKIDLEYLNEHDIDKYYQYRHSIKIKELC